MKKVIFTIGLPASGKSTWAKEAVDNGNGKIKRVNKDDLRAMIDNGKYSPGNERQIEAVLSKIVQFYLLFTDTEVVIVDSCMFKKQIQALKMDIYPNPVEFEEMVFDVDPLECIRRNKGRVNSVPEEAIWRLNKSYEAEGRIFKKTEKTNNTDNKDITNMIISGTHSF